jgi:hypothetical protein
MFKASTAATTGCDAETCTLRGGATASATVLASVVVYLDLAYRRRAPHTPLSAGPSAGSARPPRRGGQGRLRRSKMRAVSNSELSPAAGARTGWCDAWRIAICDKARDHRLALAATDRPRDSDD